MSNGTKPVGGSAAGRDGNGEYGVRVFQRVPSDRRAQNMMSVQDKTAAGKRRGQALTGALAGVAVIAVLVAVFIGIQVSDDDDKTHPGCCARGQPARRGARAGAERARRRAEPAGPGRSPSSTRPCRAKPVVKAGKGDVTKLVVTQIIAGKGPAGSQPGQTIRPTTSA